MEYLYQGGFSEDGRRPYLTHTLQKEVSKQPWSWIQISINLGIACCDKPVALPNKKIIIYNEKSMEIFRYEAISTKCCKLRQMFARLLLALRILGITK